MSTTALTRHQRQTPVAYLLLVVSLLGVSGLHRFYTGRWISGLLWFVTGGLCMIGNIVDLFFVPRMVEDVNEGRTVW